MDRDGNSRGRRQKLSWDINNCRRDLSDQNYDNDKDDNSQDNFGKNSKFIINTIITRQKEEEDSQSCIHYHRTSENRLVTIIKVEQLGIVDSSAWKLVKSVSGRSAFSRLPQAGTQCPYKRHMNIVNKFLLVCLQLIIISLMSLRVEGREGGSRPSGHVNRLLDSDIPPGPSTTRACRLYSRCSSKDVLVQNKVTATANSTDIKGELQLQTVMMMTATGRVRTRIYGMSADRYVCFNHRGRLVTKPKKKARGAKCEFVEEVSYGYSQFKSAKNEDWFIGFNQKGKPLLASAFLTQAATRTKNCFDFLKLPSSSSFNHHHHHHHGQLSGVGLGLMSSSSSSSTSSQGKQLTFPEKLGRRRGGITYNKKFSN